MQSSWAAMQLRTASAGCQHDAEATGGPKDGRRWLCCPRLVCKAPPMEHPALPGDAGSPSPTFSQANPHTDLLHETRGKCLQSDLHLPRDPVTFGATPVNAESVTINKESLFIRCWVVGFLVFFFDVFSSLIALFCCSKFCKFCDRIPLPSLFSFRTSCLLASFHPATANVKL